MKPFFIFLLSITIFHIYGQEKTQNYNDALLKGMMENKDIVLFFTAKWCGPCQLMKRTVLADSEVIEAMSDKYLLHEIDVDTPEGRELRFRYNAGNVPNTIIINSKEEILASHNGGLNKMAFIDFLGKTLVSHLNDQLKKPRKLGKPYLIIYSTDDDSVTKVMINEIFSNPQLSSYIQENYIFGRNTIDTRPRIYRKNLQGKLPVTLVLDFYKYPIKREKGYLNTEQFYSFLRDSVSNFTPEHGINFVTDEKEVFHYYLKKLQYSRWKPALHTGMNIGFPQLEPDNYQNPRLGFSIGLMVDYENEIKSFSFQFGPVFKTTGGKNDRNNLIRLSFVEIPLSLNFTILKVKSFFCPEYEPLRISFIPYTSFGIGGSIKTDGVYSKVSFGNGIQNLSRLDYGIKAGLSLSMGSFEWKAGYQFGLANLSNNREEEIRLRVMYFSLLTIFGK
jgi:thioredoxin-related protein